MSIATKSRGVLKPASRLFLVSVFALSPLFSAFGAPSPTELQLASTDWPPFTGKVGEPRMVIELVQEALKRSGVSANVTIVAEGTLTPQIKDRKFDGSPALWRDKERESYLEYSAPLMENRLVL